MNNICDALEVKLITHYLLALNKRLYEAALNCSVFVVICLLWEAVKEAQATQGCPEMRSCQGLGAALHRHMRTTPRGPAVHRFRG